MEAVKLKYNTYPSYKDSGVDWLGEIPEHWDIEKGKWLFKKEERPVRKIDEIVTCFRDGQVTLRKNRRIDGFTTALKEHGYQGIRKGDLIIHAMDAFGGSIGVSDSDGKATPVYSACTPRISGAVNPYYYACYLRNLALRGFIESLAKGIRERSTDFRFSDFSVLLLPFPPIQEQTVIVNFLDNKTTKIDQAIAQKERLIELLKERKQILIQNAVTGKIVWNEKEKVWTEPAEVKDSGVEWIGEIPVGWEVKRLKFLGKIRYGLGQPPKEKENGLPIIRATNVERGKIVRKGLIYVDPDDIPWDRNPELKKNEIIVVRSGAYTGDSAIITDEYHNTIAGYDMVFTPLIGNPKFISYALLSHYVLYEQLYLWRMRAAQPHLNAEELAETLILTPSFKEQIAIVSYIENQSTKIDKAIALQQTQIEKLKEYKSTLIDSAVTGKIKVC